jgi:hypothetical protein
MADRHAKKGAQDQATQEKKARQRAAHEGLRKSEVRRPRKRLTDHFAREIRRLHPTKLAREIMTNAPEMGSEALEFSQKMIWAAQVELTASFHAFMQAHKDCNPAEDGLSDWEHSELAMKAADTYAKGTKKLVDTIVNINRLYLDRDLADSNEGTHVGVDEWQDDIRAEMERLAEEKRGRLH